MTERKYGMSRKTCEICKNKAEYFTYTYSPETEERFVIRLCKKHQQLICNMVAWGVQTLSHRYKRSRQ